MTDTERPACVCVCVCVCVCACVCVCVFSYYVTSYYFIIYFSRVGYFIHIIISRSSQCSTTGVTKAVVWIH